MILSRVVVSDVLFQSLALPEFRKVHQAVELVHNIFEHPDFTRRVLNFHWQTNDGQIFQRFYYSCGRTNAEVLKCMLNSIHWEHVKEGAEKSQKTFLIHGCSNQNDYLKYSNQTNFIAIDLKAIYRDDYTPIHIASAIIHEIAIKLGFPQKGKVMNESWSQFTVPYAMARIAKDISIILSAYDDKLLKWCMYLKLNSFDYKPCSFSYGSQRINSLLANNAFNLLTIDKFNNGQDKHGDNFILTSLSN